MKLLRYGARGKELPGLLDAQGRYEPSRATFPTLARSRSLHKACKALLQIDLSALPPVPGSPRLGVPLAGTRKLIVQRPELR